MDQVHWDDRNRAADAMIAAHRNNMMRHVLRLNRWKVVESFWTFAEWKRHARDFAYMQGPFRAR